MEGFSKRYTRRKEDNFTIKDDYDQDVENMTKKSIMIEEKQYTQYSGKSEALHSMKRSYSILAIGFITSAFSYPFAVRIVKKVFNLKSFFNIHFAIIPIILNINAIVLGSSQAMFNYFLVLENYKIKAIKEPVKQNARI